MFRTVRPWILASFVFGLPLATWAALASAGSRNVTLQVEGTIASSPDWQDANGGAVSAISFSFGSRVASAISVEDVDSTPFTIKLVNATSYPASVALVRPGGCLIGGSEVQNEDVHFLNNGTPLSSNQAISIATDASQSFALRFAAAGQHGAQSGSVACNVPGSLTYSY